MLKKKAETSEDLNPRETSEWIEALDEVIDVAGPDRAGYLMERLINHAATFGVQAAQHRNTPYINTIPAEEEVPYPGDREIERRIKSLVRWNAMAMVVRANKYDEGIGGHISSYASQATLVEVGMNHFFRASYGDQPGDLVYFQGHASPGPYSRAFLEGRLTEKHLANFRHELRDHPGLSSYPHPWLMPDFWCFPTVSMGIGPINSIYHARFLRYLENRGILPVTPRKVWAFVGDGESDEPETLGSITLASREALDNLVWVVNCNLQRLDGPVRGNGHIIQELEALFRGAGWNVIKVIWGEDWDTLLAKDTTGLLVKRMAECVDGEYQNFAVRGGSYIRRVFFGKYPELLKLVEDLSDDDLFKLRRGGHDPQKIYNAYKRAVETRKQPTVILAMTIKGYGLGEAGEGRNVTHQQKKLNEQELEYFRHRFEIPVPEKAVHTASFYRPPDDSPEMQYLHKRRQDLGGYLPSRTVDPKKVRIKAPDLDLFHDLLDGSRGRDVMTTSAFVSILRALLKHKELGKYIVPIVPDEARTFGMDPLFREAGIYASTGQLYKPVDSEMFLYYKEAKDGQILEEGITEAGSMGSFTAAGTAYANVGVPMIPFFAYYSMFGFQRVGDLIWAFADSRGKGFLMGGTAGRTTLSGEGLQHQDGQSQILASTYPTCHIYDPAYAYEMAVVVQDGIRRMYEELEDRFYYITHYNEFYPQPALAPENRAEVVAGIIAGIYKFRGSLKNRATVQLFGSGPILNETLRAQEMLHERYGIATDVWSVTSYNELRREALAVDRWNRLHPADEVRAPYIVQALENARGPIIAASDYMKIVPDQIAPWLAGRMTTLGTDGFGRSDNRIHLRRHFEVNAEHIVAATISRLVRDGKLDAHKATKAFDDLDVDPEKVDPAIA